jgi:hypothetical protein
LGFGFWVLGFGFWVLSFGFWVLGLGIGAAHEKAGEENSKVNGSGGELCGVRERESASQQQEQMAWIRERNKTHQRDVTAHVVGSRRVQSLVPSDRRTLETCASGLMQIRVKG